MDGATFRIGIDLGGTKIEGLALSRDGAEVARRRIETPKDYQKTLLAIEGLVSVVEEEASAATGNTGLGSVGVGIPGTLSPATRVVKNSNSPWLNGHAFDKDLEAILRRPIRVMNDANCFALSEATDGAGTGASVVFGVILGTGVGAGIVIGGHVLEGHQGIGGEWGHNSLPWPRDGECPGPDCYCGRKGCIETYVSGPGMVRDHEAVTGERLSTQEIVADAARGDDDATASYGRYVDRLARGLAAVINVLDPEIVVLGGGMSNLPGLPEDVQTALPPYVFTDKLTTRVLANVHGDSSGVRGAAWLWPADDH
ncbi:MAG: ROK family protein [Gemmatimonadetes bacterium]|nr:ROK family protein [Gemmatimonadota bacterium]